MNADVLILGLVQGLTEFLPVSSSGHLALAQNLLAFSEAPLPFDVVLHVATMVATLFYFRKDIRSLLTDWFSGFGSEEGRNRPGWRFGWAVLVGTVMTVGIALPLKGVVESWMASLLAVGCALLVTSLLLGLAQVLPSKDGQVSLRTGFLVGFAQGLAVIPGISRSGSTIVTGLFSGLSPQEAFRFSFLLSLPAILGAILLQLREAGGLSELAQSLPRGWAFGALVAFVSGYLALALLRRVVTLGKWKGFALYCFLLGVVSIGLSFFRG